MFSFQDTFGYIWKSITGYDHSEFNFVVGVTPLSTTQEVVVSSFIYLISLYLFSWVWNFIFPRPPPTSKAPQENKVPQEKKVQEKKLGFITIVMVGHNFFLSAISLLLGCCLIENLWPKIMEHGIYYSACSSAVHSDHRLIAYYYVNYLIKFYELLDSFFMVMKYRPLEFLHVYHHTATMVLCFTQLRGTTVLQWVPIVLNLFVHVVMYYYYAIVALGHTVWWKQLVTIFQIAQFVIDMVCIYLGLWSKLSQGAFSGDYGCFGGLNAAIFGFYLLTSYLYLFLDFFWMTYISKKPSSRTSKPVKTE